MGETEGKHRARIRLTPPMLATMLDLPSGTTVVAAQSSNDPLGLILIVEHPDIPASPFDSESPYAQIRWEETRDPHYGLTLRSRIEWPESGGF